MPTGVCRNAGTSRLEPTMRIDMTDADWYAGLTLLERHLVMSDGLRVNGQPVGNHGPVESLPLERAPHEATHRWRRWRYEGPFAQPELFEQRLAADGLT